MEIQAKIGNGFLKLTEPELARKLKKFGHRYPNTRAKYIVKARKHMETLKDTIRRFDSQNELREWLVKNIKGIGYKEASHSLRNVGYTNFAILDFHIIDILRCKLIERPKVLTKKKYIETENLLGKRGKKLNINLAELDLYLWYIETGKILK